MRFLRKKKISRTILVISDIHLGAGTIVDGRRNYLEDFHYDKELVDFIEYYSSNEYLGREVELIINGDLFDLLAVPFVKFFDDEYWSEEASLEKLKMIVEAHPEVMRALAEFIAQKKKKIIFIIGNHDGEFVHKSLHNYLLAQFEEKDRVNFKIIVSPNGEYSPVSGVLLQHGHEYEIAHRFYVDECVVQDEQGKKYFIPPWGSYYVTRVINKFKEERDHINAVKPIKKAVINGLIYDTLYTVRFLIANTFYFTMVRFISLFKEGRSIKEVIIKTFKELELFHNLEDFCEEIFEQRPDIGCLLVGHTHEPAFRSFADGRVYINTGTWTDMHYLDWGKSRHTPQLTYAQIDVHENRKNKKHPLEGLDLALNVWKGANAMPFQEF